MATYEHENIEEFCTRINKLGIKDIGVKMVFQETDAGMVARGQNALPAKYVIVYGTLSAVHDNGTPKESVILYQEITAEATVALKTEYEELKAKVAERESEIVEAIQKHAPNSKIFSGRVKL